MWASARGRLGIASSQSRDVGNDRLSLRAQDTPALYVQIKADHQRPGSKASALILLVPLNNVATSGWPGAVFLALEIAVYSIAADGDTA